MVGKKEPQVWKRAPAVRPVSNPTKIPEPSDGLIEPYSKSPAELSVFMSSSDEIHHFQHKIHHF